MDAWSHDGIIQIVMNTEHKALWNITKAEAIRFFSRPHHEKAACIDSRSYSGYVRLWRGDHGWNCRLF